MSKKTLPGINIQFPISEKILSGKKTIETRTYRIPNKYIGEDVFLIETPGKEKFKARVTAIIRFNGCKEYVSKTEFYKDAALHLVDPGSPWAWKDKPKYGWNVEVVRVISPPVVLEGIRRGIVFTNKISIDLVR